MMSERRYKDQILAQILGVCRGDGASKTRIVYASNMNFLTIKPYLSLLILK
jgi:predicted transcriptional regulator